MTAPDFQPTLVGPTVTVRPMLASDWPEMFAAASDPEVWRLHPASDRYTEPAFRKFFDGGIESSKAFAFVDRARNRVVGSSRYHDYKPDESELEIGWTFLARSHWGGATNREVKRLMLDHAFTFVDTVVFWVGEKNFRSQGRDAEDRRRAACRLLRAAGIGRHALRDLRDYEGALSGGRTEAGGVTARRRVSG